jgi:hypothetical protein
MAQLAEFDREEFLSRRFQYRNGEHLTMAGPTGAGKTELTFQLLERTAFPHRPAIFFSMKPKDDTVDRWADKLRYPVIGSWPAPWWQTKILKPSGWILRPPISFDPDQDDLRQHLQFRRAMLHSYRKGNRIVVGDELYGLDDLGLQRHMIALWSRARSMGTGFWGGVQKPTHIPLWGYNNAEHLFLSNDPDIRNVKKFGEFGGIDPRIIEDVVPQLDEFQMLYLRRRGRVACIVNP